MEAYSMYLLKSVVWLSGFALVFMLFLRNERFFHLNRIYLLSGVIVSLIFPLISIHYTVILPMVSNLQADTVAIISSPMAGNLQVPDIKSLLFILYCSGAVFFTALVLIQGRSVLKAIKKSEIIPLNQVKLIKAPEYTSPFSFFSYVFVNPSFTDLEAKEIMIHELVHIRQKHWFDLMLAELLCILQWFNPLIWIYIRLIRQNHEYLADEAALQQTTDPAIYKAVLLNQIVGAPVVSLANSFSYSLNKKRFIMMKDNITSPYRKLKVLFILPVFALVLYSFARPDYKYGYTNENSSGIPAMAAQQKIVKGTIVTRDGNSLPGANIVVQGTTLGNTSDSKGHFKIENVPDDKLLAVSFIGYKTKIVKPDFNSEMNIVMIGDTVKYSLNDPPLYIVDGKETSRAEAEKINPENLDAVNVLKDKSGANPATDKYGEKGKNGVVEITTKKTTGITAVKEKKDIWVVMEELPQFPGGKDVLNNWIAANIKYPGEALKAKISGKVYVSFIVGVSGKVKDAVVIRSSSPALNNEAVRVISSMPDWKPATQSGKNVPVQMELPVEFRLN